MPSKTGYLECYLLFDGLDTDLWIFRKENKHLICKREALKITKQIISYHLWDHYCAPPRWISQHVMDGDHWSKKKKKVWFEYI